MNLNIQQFNSLSRSYCRSSARANVQILVTVVGHVSHKTVLLAHGRWAVGNCMSNELIKIVIDLAQFNQRDSATQLCIYTVHIYRYVCTNIYVYKYTSTSRRTGTAVGAALAYVTEEETQTPQ